MARSCPFAAERSATGSRVAGSRPATTLSRARRRVALVGVVLGCVGAGSVARFGAPGEPSGGSFVFAAPAKGKSQRDVQTLSRRVDRTLRLRKSRLSPDAKDSEFLRRVYLDLAGTVPTAARAQAFLQDSSPDRRERLIDELLESSAFGDLWGRIWAEVLLGDYDRLRGNFEGKALDGKFGRKSLGNFQSWLAREIVAETSWQDVVSRLIRSTGPVSRRPEVYYKATFFDGKVDALTFADEMSRSLLGVRISCARCHDHPFDRWKQKDFFGLAAFFMNLEASAEGEENVTEVALTERVSDGGLRADGRAFPPTFFFGGRAQADAARLPQLAKFLSKHRDQLARNVVNRTWALLMGRGFVEPVDDFNLRNKARHGAVLDLLSREFLRRGESMKDLLRVLCNTAAYQRSSTGGGDEWLETREVRALSPEQLLRSILTASSGAELAVDWRDAEWGEQRKTFLRELREVYPAGKPWTEVSRLPGNTAQVLFLQNSRWMRQRIDKGGLVRRLRGLEISAEETVGEIFLAVLSRWPDADERPRYSKYIEENGGWRACSDLVWALVNSSEFITQH